MHSKKQIQQLLASAGVNPNKIFGQNFLIDLNLMNLLIETAAPTKDDLVLEVGPGTGSLTQGLAETAGQVIAVEIDTTMAKITKMQLAEFDNVEVINVDVLKSKHTINPIVVEAINNHRKNFTGRFILIANLPYNIATPLMLNLIVSEPHVDSMFVTVQREVAQRMAAEPATNLYGILSIVMAAVGRVKLIRTLKPAVFWPPPKVDSAMLGFTRDEEKFKRINDIEIFIETINLFMQHRRKTLKGCTKLAHGKLEKIDDWKNIFEKAQIDSQLRPEQLSFEDFIKIANLCC